MSLQINSYLACNSDWYMEMYGKENREKISVIVKVPNKRNYE